MRSSKLGSGFEPLEAREVPATATIDNIQIGFPDNLREPSPTVADQVLLSHAAVIDTVAAVERSVFTPQWPGVNGDVKGVVENADLGGGVHDLAFSPDGSKMVTAGSKTVTLRNAVTGALIRELPVHPSQITAVDFSPDGTKLVTVSWDKTAKLINVADGSVIASKALLNIGNNVRFLSDGVRIVMSSADQPLQMWHTDTGWVVTLNSGGSALGDVQGDDLVFIQNTEVVVRNVSTSAERRYAGLGWEGTAAAISTDGSLIAAGDYKDGIVHIWNRATGARIASLPGMWGTITDLEFLPGKILLVSGAFNAVKVWDLSGASPALLKTYAVSGVERFAMPPNSDKLAVSSGISVRLLQLPSGAVPPPLPTPESLAAVAAAKSALANTLNTAWDDDWAAYGNVNIDAVSAVTTASFQSWMDTLAPANATPLEVLEYRLEAITAEIAALEEQRPLVTVMPSMTTTAYRNDVTHLSVAVTNMPANIYVRFGSVLTYLPTGSGTTKIPLSSFTHGDRRVYNIELVRANGTVLESNLGGFGIQSGAHTYGGYGYDPTSHIPSVASLPQQVPGNLPADLQARMTALQAEKAEVEAEIAVLDPGEEDPPEQSELATAQSVADSISALTTNENGEALTVEEIAERLEEIRGRTQRNQREAALAIPILRTRIAALTATLPQLEQALRDVTTAGQWDYAYGRLSGAQLEIADCERMLQGAYTAFAGLNAMRDTEVEISVVGVSGTQLVLEVVNAPVNSYFLGYREDRSGTSYHGWRTYFSHHFTANSEGSTLVAIPFNGTIPTGEFQLRLVVGGQEVYPAERQMVSWNKEATSLTLIGSSFSKFSSFPVTEGLTEPTWDEQQAARDAAQTLALGVAPLYVYWEPSYTNINAMLQERLWTALGLSINRVALNRAYTHAYSPTVVAATPEGDATLKAAYLQANSSYPTAEDTFNRTYIEVMNEGERRANLAVDTYQQGVVKYFTHLLKLKTGSASTFDTAPLHTPYPDLVPPGPIVMGRVAERFDTLYGVLGGVRTTQEEWLANRESLSVYMSTQESYFRNQENAVRVRINQISALRSNAPIADRIATILANHPDGAEAYLINNQQSVRTLLAANQPTTEAAREMLWRFGLASQLANGNGIVSNLAEEEDATFAGLYYNQSPIVTLADSPLTEEEIATLTSAGTVIGKHRTVAARAYIQGMAAQLRTGPGSTVLNISNSVDTSLFTGLTTAPRSLLQQSLAILASIPSELNQQLGYADGKLGALEAAFESIAKKNAKVTFDTSRSVTDRASSFVSFSLLTSLQTFANVAKNLIPASVGETLLMAGGAELGPVIAKAFGIISARGIASIEPLINKLSLAYRNAGTQGMISALDGEVDIIATPVVRENVQSFFMNESIHVYRPLFRFVLTEADKINIRHIILGEINDQGKAVGGHSFEAIRNGTVRIVEGTQTFNGAIMRAQVEIWDPARNIWVRKIGLDGKPQVNTFFPEGWSIDTIINAIEQAASKPYHNAKGLWAGIGNDLEIQLRFAGKVITSAFPTF